MAKFRVETQLAIDKASAAAAKTSMEGLTKAATQLGAVLVGEKAFVAPFKALKSVIEDSIAASDKATAAQERIREAAKSVYKVIGDELTPGMNQLAESISNALANPEIQRGLETAGQLLSVMATGISEVVDEIAGFVGSPAFSSWLQFLYGVDLNSDTMKAYREQGKAVDEITAAVSKWAKGVAEQQKAEEKAAEARKKAHAEHLKALEAILDKVNPIAKAERETWQQILTLNQALKSGEIDVNTYQQAMAFLTRELNNVKEAAGLAQQEIATLDIAPRDINTDLPAGPMQGGSMTIEQIETAASRYEDAMTEAGKNFSRSLESGMTSAIASAMSEFLHTGENNVKALGQMLLDTLLNAAAEYFAQMVVNQAKLKMANGAQGANGSNGMGSAMGAMGNVAMAAAVVYAVYAITDAIKKANDAGKFKETAAAGVYRGGVGSTYAGELSAQGRQMADALRGFLNLMQSVAGSWITSMGEIGVRVSGDGKKFQAMVGGEIIGTFKSMSEAMVRAFQASFSDATFASEINPIIRDMVTNYRGTDIEELKNGLQQVKSVLDQVSGLSDIEIAIKDLPFQADALKQSMVQLGASFEDASALAARWQATQMGNLRDQITGHQATEAEQRAQKEREALLFNAQLALNKAEIQMKRDKLAADIEILKAGGSLNLAELNITTQYLGQFGRLAEVKAELLNQDIQIQQGHVNLMTAAGQAALASLQLQLDALNQVYEILDSIKPISLGEIRIPGAGRHGGGGHANAGPTEAEQRETAFNDFLKNLARDGMTDVQRALAELNDRFAEQAQAARELGRVEELEAERVKAIARIRQDFLDGLKLDGMSEYQRRLFELNKAFADQAALNADLAGSEAELAAARHAALSALREDLLDSFGTPMEALRDRIAGIQQKLADLAAANNELLQQFQKGEISAQQYADAIAHGEEVVHDFILGLGSELLNLALYFTDALGDTQESARIRKQLAILEWQYKKLELVMMLNAIRLAGGFGAATVIAFGQLGNAVVALVNRVAVAAGNVVIGGPAPVEPTLPPPPTVGGWTYQQWMDWINSLPDAPPGGGAGDSSGSNAAEEARNQAEQALRAALDRLRSAIEGLREFEEGLLLSDVSPLTTSQQYEEAARQYAATLAAAQGGDLAAIEALAGNAQTYLELATQMFGTAGAGYGDIFAAVQQQIADIIAAGQQVLDAAPPQMQGTESRLDTIAEILRAIAQTGGTGSTGGINPHEGLVNYGDFWGWHPLGWSPPGGWGHTATTASAAHVASLGSSGNLVVGNFGSAGTVTVNAPAIVAKLDALTAAHAAATIEAKADRMKPIALSRAGFSGQSIGTKRSA